ncbi:MAG: hypothetical protein IKP78_02810 [Ruminococcus sp.]|nr:hypothetical protein [Ruminococcus sp.]
MKSRNIKAYLVSLAIIASGIPFFPASPVAAASVLKYDLGANGQSGWTSVSASQVYDKNKGFGFSSNKEVKNVAASGNAELSDAVQFTGNTTFNVDLAKGLYNVKVRLGNTSRTSIYMEDMLQIVNMTGNNAVDEVIVPVTDGQLNIRAGAGKSGTAFSISSIEIEKISDDPTLPPTVWICGDSTVCNYYPLDTSVQGGWGQMLGHYIDKSWNIRNMAASGQYAQGFVQAGQFTPIETYGKKGDVFIISIGINDSKYYNGDVYNQVVTDMVQRAKKKGMEVILVKQQGRNGDAQRNPLLTSRWYAGELDNIGKNENVQVVDLFKLWQDHCISIGADKTTALYMNGDTLHPNRAGAEKLAELFATQFSQVPEVSEPVKVNDGSFISGLTVYDSDNSGDWSVQSGLDTGKEVFGDRQCKFTFVPDELKGAEWIRTACDSKKYAGNEASFTAARDITVYVGIDTRAESNAGWLSDWTKTSMTMTDDGSPAVTYNVYRKDAKNGEKVTLGAVNMNAAVNYIVVATEYSEHQGTAASQNDTETFIRGDLDRNGRIDSFDMVLMRQGLVSGFDGISAELADLNGNGSADASDAEMLLYFILGKNVDIVPYSHKHPESAQTDENARKMEYLNRGISAVSTGKDVFISWRSLATDSDDTTFNVYRTADGKTVRLNSAPLTGGTNFTDTGADLKKDNTYSVNAVVNGKELAADDSDTLKAGAIQQCKILNIKSGSKIHFVWVGDFDGDGEYDYLVDRNTDTYQKLEAYKSDGTYLWTIDLGYNSENKNNITPGASAIDVGMWDGATVYDMDCDGYADVLLRIADGVIFGDGKKFTYTKDTQAQFIAVIDGRTGVLKDYTPVPDDFKSVGTMACMMEVGCLDGVNPSVICWMKNRNKDKTFNSMTAAFGYENGAFRLRWRYKNDILFNDRTEYKNGYAEAHQIRVTDVDYDGKDEVLHMGYCLNGDGTLRYHIDEIVHGDRWFVGSFSNKNNGREMYGYGIQQKNQYGLLEYMYNASTGEMLWTNYSKSSELIDVGRGNIGDIDPNYEGFEVWSFQGLYNYSGKRIGDNNLYPCIRLWWDGDLLAESYNDSKFEKWNWQAQKVERLLSPWKITDSAGSDRGAPMFYGDITGDWREEVIMTSSDYSKLVIWCPTAPTDIRLTCLAQDPCYRNCMTAKGYYQSHMLSYYLGTGMETPQKPNISIITK